MHLYASDECHAWFHFYGTSGPARSLSKATKCKMKNSCSQWDSNPKPWDLKSDALPAELSELRWKLYYLNDLYSYMYFRYQFIHWYKFDNDEVERILSCKCTVLCYILEYCYIGQITKRLISPVFVFNMQNTIKYSTWSGIKHDVHPGCISA